MNEINGVQQAVQRLYAGDPEYEWRRLERHRTEFAVTLRALAEHLPPAPARVLDCGGGPGRYAIELARQGYQVTLFDLSPELLALGQEKAAEAGVTLAGFEQGSAADLARFPDASFDAVLLMGPLYHLLDEAGRRQALSEAYRVARPGGMVFAAFISRYAGYLDAAAHYPERAVESPEEYQRILDTGLLPPEEGRGGFVAYFTHPCEVEPLCRSVGFDVRTVLGVEGLVSMLEEGVNALDGKAWEFWVDLNYRVAPDASIHGAVEHLLAVCHKPRWRSVLCEIATQLNAAGIAYTLVGGTSLAVRGLPVPVNDIDLEMAPEDTYRFQALFADRVVEPVALWENPKARSHMGRFDFDGVKVEVMGGLQWREGDRWLPSFLATKAVVELEGVSVPVLELEEETLAYVRRGRLERAALCLPHCDPERLLALMRDSLGKGMW